MESEQTQIPVPDPADGARYWPPQIRRRVDTPTWAQELVAMQHGQAWDTVLHTWTPALSLSPPRECGE